MTRKAYVPVAKKSLLWLLLFATIYPVILVVGIDLMPGISRLAAASKSATSFLESSWGPVPNPETRLGRRNFVGACGIIDAAVLVVLMAVAAALSNAMGADWLKWVAVVPVIPAGLAVGAGMVLGFRGGGSRRRCLGLGTCRKALRLGVPHDNTARNYRPGSDLRTCSRFLGDPVGRSLRCRQGVSVTECRPSGSRTARAGRARSRPAGPNRAASRGCRADPRFAGTPPDASPDPASPPPPAEQHAHAVRPATSSVQP